jgi:NAD(P)-dependent dehydrogenase (short-subunit alcohol dehydrogenase family)
MANISFTGQVVIVTGAGAGLGRAYALELARRGAMVVVNDIGADGAAADGVVAEIELAGGAAVASHASVATALGGREIVASAVREFGGVHSVVHNAGIAWSGALDELSDAELDRMLDVHVRGAFFVLRPAWALMRDQSYGRIVLASSSSGVFARDDGSSYAAAKAALFGLAKSLSHEGAPHGIVVNSFLPYAQTTISDDFLSESGRAGSVTQHTADALRKLYAHGLPTSEVVPLVVYLASAECRAGGRAYWACGRRYAEVFVGLTEGWTGDAAGDVTAEDVAAHLPEIRARDSFTTPESMADELERELARLGVS